MLADVAKFDRYLLLIYLAALFSLLVLPISEPKFFLLGIKSDKWFHVALFAGLAMLLRWNFAGRVRPSVESIIAATAVAFAIEVIQALINYRSAEWLDLLAGALGAVIGAATMRRILHSRRPDHSVGVLVATLGMMIIVFSVLADLIRFGSHVDFGPRQFAGTVLGFLILVGGILVYARGLPGLAGLRDVD